MMTMKELQDRGQEKGQERGQDRGQERRQERGQDRTGMEGQLTVNYQAGLYRVRSL